MAFLLLWTGRDEVAAPAVAAIAALGKEHARAALLALGSLGRYGAPALALRRRGLGRGLRATQL